MKLVKTIFLVLLAHHAAIAQEIDSLEHKLANTNLTTNDSIETLNLLSRSLTFIDPVKSLAIANKALELSTKAGNSTGIAYAYRNLASVYSYNESYFISMEYLQRALDFFELSNDSVGIANCYISLGHTYRQLHKREEEIFYHKKSFEIFKRLNNKERLGVTAHNLGESYYNIGDFSMSRELTNYAIELNQSLDNKPVLASCFKVMGMIELAEGNFGKAEDYFKRVLAIAAQLKENSQKMATVESMFQLAVVSKYRGDSEGQLRYLLMASQFSAKNKLLHYLQKSYQELILYSSLKNDQAGVRKFVATYLTLSDSLNQLQLSDRYSLTNSVVQVHDLSKSKLELERSNLVQAAKIENRNTLLIVIAISAVVLLWLALKFVWLNKKLQKQNEIIEKQKIDLEVLNNTKNKFFSIVAHDLKSPLNSLKAFSSLLIDHFDSLNKDEILNMSKQLRESVDNTIKMANNLITWARIQMADYRYNEEVIKVKDIASNICEVYQDVALKKGIHVNCSVEDSLAVVGDKNQIEFVIRNLVNNAIKFTHKGGFVSLTAKSLPEEKVQISVADSGVGISDEFKSKIFSINEKQSTKGTDGEKGTGLGLMLSFEFVKLNGGQIEIESSLGKGTTFHTIFKRGHTESSNKKS